MKGKTLLIIVLVVLALVANPFRIYYARTAMEQGKIAYDQGDYDLAIARFTRAIKLNFWDKEEKADNLLWRGRAYYEKEEFNQALADFNKAIELRPNDFVCYLWRARTHEKMSNYDLAIADFSKSIELDGGGRWNTYLERAHVYFINGDYVLEIADYDRAISALDEIINSRDISSDRIDDLKKERNNIISDKRRTERLIEWRINNPEGNIVQWMILDLFTRGLEQLEGAR